MTRLSLSTLAARACLALLVSGLCACATAGDVPGPVVGADAAPVAEPDAEPVPADADATPSAAIGHLLISEVALAPAGAEFIEIYNPTDAPISLAGYYLCDAAAYYQLPLGPPALDTRSDFLVAFPGDATLEPGAVAVVSIGSSAAFQTASGVSPEFSIGDASGTTRPMLAVVRGTEPTLTNAGEAVALFYWDGNADLVSDVDLLNVGMPSGANSLTAKTGIAIDGPDDGTTPTSYATDAFTIGAQPGSPGPGTSTKRLTHEAGFEIQDGVGNGITGDDETSETTSTTWDRAFTAPTPGTVPPSLAAPPP